MKKILVFVSSLDGKITKWDDPEVRIWTSASDQEYFKNLWLRSALVVMGRKTYETNPVRPSENQLIIIMTRSPEIYKDSEVKGMLEFRNDTPIKLVTKYEDEGYPMMTIVGGGKLATSFLKDKLIDELWLTIEPRIFGMGANIVTNEKLDISLQLISCENANENGTLITKYSIIKE